MTKIHRFSLLLFSMLLFSACTITHPPAYRLPNSTELIAGKKVSVLHGENLYTIAQKHKVRLNEIIVVNAMKPPYRVKPGQVIYLPEKARPKTRLTKYYAPTPKAAPIEKVYKKPLIKKPTSLAKSRNAHKKHVHKKTVKKVSKKKEYIKKTAVKKRLIKKKKTKKIASKKRSTQLGVPPFVWPVRGTIISAFGPKGKSRDNDGVNIAAPRNSPVKASDSGTVVYADNKMKGFGNLVLIRHKNGWVTAYAHLGRILVVRDKRVSKGSVIGTIGTTGGVVSSQLHFETRRDGKPTDPELVVR